MVDALLSEPATWLDGSGPNSDVVISTHCRLVRNIADHPFVSQCHDDERSGVEERILNALDSLNMTGDGQYHGFGDVDETQARFLLERRLISPQMIESRGVRGVHVQDGQLTSLCINGADHLILFGHASGEQVQEIWSRLSLIDDSLSGLLDFTFDDRLGFLTASLSDVGTGLKTSAFVHLPALTMLNAIEAHRESVRTHRLELTPWMAAEQASGGELYELTNRGTLGVSETEIVYQAAQVLDELVESERSAQQRLMQDFRIQLEDRVERALALAQQARLLAFEEGVDVLSSLRLGVSTGLLNAISPKLLNETLMASQRAHLELKSGELCDETRSCMLRAELFREKFSGTGSE